MTSYVCARLNSFERITNMFYGFRPEKGGSIEVDALLDTVEN